MLRSILGLILAAVLSCGLSAQANRQLYLVTGYTTRDGPLTVSSNLFKVDSTRHTFEYVQELAAEKEGSFSTTVDHDRRVVAVVSGSNQAVVFSMDGPSVLLRYPISYKGFITLTSFFDAPGGGATLALETLSNDGQRLSGVDLSPLNPTATQHDLDWKAYQNFRTEGYWNPGDAKRYGGALQFWIKDGKALSRQTTSLSKRESVDVEVAIPLPKEAVSQTDNQSWGVLVNNDEITVLMRLFALTLDPTETKGKTRFYIYDKKSQSWHNEDFENGNSIRGFGTWVVVCEEESNVVVVNGTAQPNPSAKESPGRDLRQRVLNPQDRRLDQATIDNLFSNYFPGIIHVYDVRSGKRYRIETGQGDSEVLLVDGTTIYYRVNDTLYRAEIGTSSITNPVEIVRNENVQLAHWAFLGP